MYKPHPEFGNLNFGKNIWKEIQSNQKWSLEKDVSLYMHCFFKVLERFNPRINSPTLKTEKTKTLTDNFSSLIV